MRTRIARAAFAAALLAGVAAWDAGAQMMGTGSGPGFFSNGIGRGSGMPGSPANMQVVATAWLADLYAQLQVTPDQEGAWQAFANAVMAQAIAMQSLRTQMAQTSSMNAPQRALLAEQVMGRRLDAAGAVSDSLSALYARLDPRQRAAMDREFAAQCGAFGLFGS